VIPNDDFETDDREDASGIRHVVLLGDGLGDLARMQQSGALEGRLLPARSEPWKLTLLSASDIARTSLRPDIPKDATHVVISIEGNRAIEASGVLGGQPASYEEGLARLSFAADQFEDQVEALIRAGQATRLPTVICTMWPPRYPEPVRQRAAVAALTIFNWRIFRRALAAGISIVDLHNACSEQSDYADDTLLSMSGLRKAANVVSRALREVTSRGAGTEVFW